MEGIPTICFSSTPLLCVASLYYYCSGHVCVCCTFILQPSIAACERKSKHWSVNGIPMETSDQASSVSPKPFLHFSPVCIFKCSLKHQISVNENLVPEPVQPSDWQVECFECFHRKDSNDASSMSQKVNIGLEALAE